ncbi:hypothetical protein [Neobacillus sp. DY30]|nr:hypothetical protein [Neobacillus sp. DY30]WHY02595.1 hypothetical protein QNH29_10380 [Neobacillus sp. DY30]
MNKVPGGIQILDGIWRLYYQWVAEKPKGYSGEIQIDSLLEKA